MIKVREYEERRPNGDRAQVLSRSAKFVVELITENSAVELKTFDQFDPYATAIIGTRAEIAGQALAYAERIAKACSTHVEFVRMIREEVTTVTFHEEHLTTIYPKKE